MGLASDGRADSADRPRAISRMGLGTSASLQECPPGPLMVTPEAPAAEGSGDRDSGPGALQCQGGGDSVAVWPVFEDVAHAAEVAFTLLADVGAEEDGRRRRDVGEAHGGDESEQRGEAGGVVARAGAEDAGVLLGGDGVDAGGEDGVEMGGDEDERSGRWTGGGCGSHLNR